MRSSKEPTIWRNRIVRYSEELPASLPPSPHNWREHGPLQTAALGDVLGTVGVVQNVIMNERTGRLVDGHLRVSLALESGQARVPVTWVDLTEDEESLILATLDPIGALAQTNRERLSAILSEVKTGSDAVRDVLDGLADAAGIARDAGVPIDDVEPQIDRAAELRAQYGVELGQLWGLGNHRLLCGDSTDAACVARLMGGERIAAIFTSPPYDQQRTYNGGMAADWTGLLVGVCTAFLPHLEAAAQIFINLGLVHREGRVVRYWDTLIAWLEEHEWPLFGWYVWDKLAGMPGNWNGRLAPAHEWVLHFAREHIVPAKTTATKSYGRNNGGNTQRNPDGTTKKFTSSDPVQPFKIPDSVIRTSPQQVRDGLLEIHPAAFPIQLPKTFIDAYAADVWYEPFSGSGTTILACEQSGRISRAIELDPGYVAVALHRWESATGQTAVRIE